MVLLPTFFFFVASSLLLFVTAVIREDEYAVIIDLVVIDLVVIDLVIIDPVVMDLVIDLVFMVGRVTGSVVENVHTHLTHGRYDEGSVEMKKEGGGDDDG